MTSQVSASEGQSKAFSLLAEPVRRWVWRKGWTGLRDIQESAIPHLIDADTDLIIAAATAGGKTEAAFLPLVSRAFATTEGQGFDLVYVGPLRALINDQFQRLEELCEALEMPVHPWHGDIAQGVKMRARKNPGGILLITPESLEAMFVLRGVEIPRLFAGTQAIVIDELHALLDSERGVHLRSLLTRLELAAGRRIRRVGLSATLGDMTLANAYLRPEAPEDVVCLVSRSEEHELRVQLRGYVARRKDGVPDSDGDRADNAEVPDSSAVRAVGEHLFDNLRGTNNLVFAGSRQSVEVFSDLLRSMCEERKLPNEFFPHHANLSREHREFVERRLKSAALPVTAVCTSTLELGLDIGDVACVGQVGAPWSVAALRQRLGRSGRRARQPAVLRMYAIEAEPEGDSHLVDRLHLSLIRSIAMVELLVEGWCETAPDGSAPSLNADASDPFRDSRARWGVCTKDLCDPLRSRPVPVGRTVTVRSSSSPTRRRRGCAHRAGARWYAAAGSGRRTISRALQLLRCLPNSSGIPHRSRDQSAWHCPRLRAARSRLDNHFQWKALAGGGGSRQGQGHSCRPGPCR